MIPLQAVASHHHVVLTPEGDGSWFAFCRRCVWQRSGSWEVVRAAQKVHEATRDAN